MKKTLLATSLTWSTRRRFNSTPWRFECRSVPEGQSEFHDVVCATSSENETHITRLTQMQKADVVENEMRRIQHNQKFRPGWRPQMERALPPLLVGGRCTIVLTVLVRPREIRRMEKDLRQSVITRQPRRVSVHHRPSRLSLRPETASHVVGPINNVGSLVQLRAAQPIDQYGRVGAVAHRECWQTL